MTGKVFAVVIGVVVILILIMALPAIPDAVESFRTDTLTQSYTLATGASNNGSVALSNNLWNSDIAYISRVASTLATDNSVASTYTAASRSVLVTGLAANTTRTLTIDYRTAGLEENTAADTGITLLPGIVVGMVIIIPLIVVAGLLLGRR